MIDFKKNIAEKIGKAIKIASNGSEEVQEIEVQEIERYIEEPKDSKNGDYAFPCFKLSKQLKKAPVQIANEIKEKIEMEQEIVTEIKVESGYLNFYINKNTLAKEVIQEISQKEEYGASKIGEGKNIIVEYSSPNIAKQFHIGHLRTTIIGATLYEIYKYLGYNAIGINHLGDYGTQFGKLIEGYKRWKDEYDIDSNPIEELTKIYIRISELCKQDESVLEASRENFRLLENQDPYYVELWEKFRELSLKEFQRIYDMLDVKFDSVLGEAFYEDKMEEIYKELEEAGVLKESKGAQIVDLEPQGLGVCIIKKTDGTSIYATRDLAAIKYRAKTYNFDKCLYVVGSEQALYFKQLFEVAKYLKIPEKCKKGLEHVQYGMVNLPTGRMSTREGNVVKVEELLNEAINRVEKIMEEKNPEMQDKKENAKKIGLGAVIYNNVANTIIKDQIFDWDSALNFQGETGPYIQYIYVRTKSVLEKAGISVENININQLNYEELMQEEATNILKLLYKFQEKLIQVTEKNDPSILARYLIELAQSYSIYYNDNKILVEDEEVKNTRIYITYSVGKVLKIGAKLLKMQMPNKM